ncbi:c-type cytochrome [Sagittula salina]|uniref:C-type cytochrome n=1 Tax=Sagittula salina TaxID=2820268 RepID=A0A940MRE1_9RHOB|nr:c-type cytochrome [Sagittula salina]MBP0483999.1 c-type cytochrome [Sagittula salina]
MTLKKRWIAWAAVGVVALGNAIFWLAPYNIAASVPHLPGVGEVLHQYMRNSVRARARSVAVPDHVDLDDPGLIRLGAGHFATGCQTCHGAPGIPRNPVVLGMRPEPPALTSENWTAKDFWWIARHGFKYTGMPAWPGKGREDEPWAMAAFLTHYDEFDAASYADAAWGDRQAWRAAAVRFGEPSEAVALENACIRCHGKDGLGREGTAPKLAGQSEAWLELVLSAYAGGHRESGFMEPLAAGLTEEQRSALGQRFAGMDGAWQGRPVAGDPERGRMLAETGSEPEDIANCASCHEGAGTDGLSPRRADTPRIAGQDGYWLVNWLTLYRDGPVPDTPRAHLMAAAAKPLSDEDIADLAAYYAGR